MARPKLRPDLGVNTEDTENMTTDFYSPVKQMVRTIQDTQSAEQVDYELGNWYSMGYRLFAAHNLMASPTGITILYVLVKDVP